MPRICLLHVGLALAAVTPCLLATLHEYHEIVAQLAYYPAYGEDVWLPVLRARAQALFEAPAQE